MVHQDNIIMLLRALALSRLFIFNELLYFQRTKTKQLQLQTRRSKVRPAEADIGQLKLLEAEG